MRYLTRFRESNSERLLAILDMHWGMIREWIHLIASASYPFPEVMKALAEPMCVVPIEGLPGERYLPGTSAMDAIESRAEELLCQMFAAPTETYKATIQPHSGTQANQIVFNAVLRPDDVVLSLRPNEGGHISHTVLIGRRNRVAYYCLSDDGRICYPALDELAQRERPRLIIAGGSACPRAIDFAALSSIARRSGSLLHADVSHTATFIAAGLHSAVLPYADFVTFNMMKNMRGPNGGVLIYRRDYQRQVSKGLFPETQGGPNENTMLAKLVALEKLSDFDLKGYAERIIRTARRMGTILENRGLSLVTGGTDCHLLLVDLRRIGITGQEAEHACEQYRVLVNRNLVPNDRLGPKVSSGVRIGTACLSILEYSDEDIEQLANWLADRFTKVESPNPIGLIDELCRRYNSQLLPKADL